uniref:Prepilin-type N-terminal cleavage/methylation domain-containing protein n=1 Tax=uncultured Desulfobacterium sp. TaxID=201089 RepID=E1YBG8_9BACT|nr:hypothetical protein N47_G32360 [uncultured Desulfobacterium sp.]
MKSEKGFLVLEILIAGLILTAGIATTMYLFRIGYTYLEQARKSNILSSKLIQTSGLFKSLDLNQKTGTEDLGDGVNLTWEAKLLETSRPVQTYGDNPASSLHELYLYEVDFSLSYQDVKRDYIVNVFRYKPLFSPENL